jgi:hypothetical protein
MRAAVSHPVQEPLTRVAAALNVCISVVFPWGEIRTNSFSDRAVRFAVVVWPTYIEANYAVTEIDVSPISLSHLFFPP